MDSSIVNESESSIQSISLIIVCSDTASVDERIWQAVRKLGTANCRAELRLVDPAMQVVDQRITYRPIPPAFASVSEALSETKYQRVAILDGDGELSAEQWASLVSGPDDSTKAIFNSGTAQGRSRGILLWFYSVFVFLFLKTRKHEFTRGAIIFSSSQSAHYIPHLDGKPKTDVTRIIALARLHERRAVESVSYVPRPESTDSSSRPVRAAFKRAIRFWYTELMFPKRHVDVAQSKPKKSKRYLITLTLMLIASMLLFGNLSYPLFEPDETRNAELALALVDSNDWSVLKLYKNHYWDKPPLQTWAIACSYKIFGASPWSTRLPIAMASLLTVVFTFVLGRRLLGFWAATAATTLLMSTLGFVVISRYTTMDASLTAMTTAMFLFGYLSIQRGFSRSKSLLAGVAAGVGLMVKGPIIVVLCGPPLLLAQWLERDRITDRSQSRTDRLTEDARRVLWFLVPAALIATPWFAFTAYHYPEFVSQFFWKHNLVRFSQGFNHAEPGYFYLVGVFVFMFPVSYLIPSAFRYATSTKYEHVQVRSREAGFLLLSIGWIFLFFSFSSAKLPTYVLPAFPLICLLIGAMLEQWVFVNPVRRSSLLQRLIRRAPVELPAWSIAFAVAGYVWLQVSVMATAFVIGLSFACGAAMLTAQFNEKQKRARRTWWAAIAGVTMVIATATAHQYLPAFSRQRSDLAAIAELFEADQGRGQIVFFGRDPHAAEQMLNKSVIYFDENQAAAAAEFMQTLDRAVLVASDECLGQLGEIVGERLCFEKVKQGRHVFEVEVQNDTAPIVRAANSIDETDVR
jgi:dolichol-phosphate mannosyltransferase